LLLYTHRARALEVRLAQPTRLDVFGLS
jgi:hypothetical protein